MVIDLMEVETKIENYTYDYFSFLIAFYFQIQI